MSRAIIIFVASGAYTGFLGPTTDADVAAAYPAATYRRLADVKQRYDPGNVFRRNHNIRPAGARVASASSSGSSSPSGSFGLFAHLAHLAHFGLPA